MYSKDEAYSQIAELTQRFTEQFASYKKSDYNETLTRRDFIDPFFKALGWDVDNSQGYAEAYREVIHEDRLKVGTATKAPDYSFRLPGGKRLFFVEAKKPSVFVRDELLPAYQVRRYGWSAKLSISLITDFEELAVYDCTKKPNPGDKASTGRIKYLTYKNYLDEFDFIWTTFSKSSVLKGSFDKFIAADTNKKGTATVDKAFLASLDEWRMLLATNIAQRNHHLTEDELNFVVQQTIDRIIFLRIAEDRKVEEYGELQSIIKGVKAEGSFYAGLYKLFVEADSKYNSGLFDFNKDKLSNNVHIDNRVLKNIINELYYPVCPYEFSVLGVEILGSAYEQFLGKQIKLDDRHRAVIEEKPEVRKAGGVYYTPQYIVDYIVENTVGKLVAGKTPADVEKLTIVDPACGSGSFLLGAYDFLLRWHVEYYKPDFIKLSSIATSTGYNTTQRNNAIKERNKLPLTPEGNLTTAIKKQILLNNLYGVDLDTQAVEVTKLSLLLKCMEGETGSSINAQMRFGERVLPTLDNNIKSGNSLIDLDFYDTEHTAVEEKKIKPFSWQQAFPKVFSPSLRGTKQSKGFDVVIGNPPYSLIGSDRKNEQAYYTSGRFRLNAYKINTYILFIEKGFELLRLGNGILGYIIPKSLVFNTYFDVTRRILLSEYSIPQIVEIKDKVFEDAEVGDSILFFGEKSTDTPTKVLSYYKVQNIFPNFKVISSYKASQKSLLEEHHGKFFPSSLKIKINTQPLGSLCNIFNGLNPGNVRHILLATEKKSIKYKKMVLGKDIQRYNLTWSGTWVNYDVTLKDRLTKDDIQSKVGMTAQGKVDFALRSESIYLGPKILVRKTGDHIIATFDSDDFYYDSLAYGIMLHDNSNVSILFILGLLNSKLLNYFHEGLSDNKNKIFAKVLATNLSLLPFPRDFDKLDKKVISNIESNAEAVTTLQKQKRSTILAENIDQLNQRIAYTDDKINKLVYELYGLSEEEIAIVEGR